MEGQIKSEKTFKAPRFSDEQKFALWNVLACHRDTLAEMTVDEAMTWVNQCVNPKLGFEMSPDFEGSFKGTCEAMNPPLFFKRREPKQGENQHTRVRREIIARIAELEKKLSQPLTGYVELPEPIRKQLDATTKDIITLRRDVNTILAALHTLSKVNPQINRAVKDAGCPVGYAQPAIAALPG